jgi:hypothetical protein
VHDASHGTRRHYQKARCRCPRCTTANTQYSAHWNAARRTGRPFLGAHVAGREAARIVAALVADGYPKTQIAAWLGYRCRRLSRNYTGAGVTVRTLLRLRAIERRVWLKGV